MDAAATLRPKAVLFFCKGAARCCGCAADTAKALGLNVPHGLLNAADEVIE
ncbi:MAG: hypothetical protein WA679_05895 [Pseudolabrys sp.]